MTSRMVRQKGKLFFYFQKYRLARPCKGAHDGGPWVGALAGACPGCRGSESRRQRRAPRFGRRPLGSCGSYRPKSRRDTASPLAASWASLVARSGVRRIGEQDSSNSQTGDRSSSSKVRLDSEVSLSVVASMLAVWYLATRRTVRRGENLATPWLQTCEGGAAEWSWPLAWGQLAQPTRPSAWAGMWPVLAQSQQAGWRESVSSRSPGSAGCTHWLRWLVTRPPWRRYRLLGVRSGA